LLSRFIATKSDIVCPLTMSMAKQGEGLQPHRSQSL